MRSKRGVCFEVSMTSMSRLDVFEGGDDDLSRVGVSISILCGQRGAPAVEMVRGNIVENRFRQQIAGTVAVAHQIADQRGGDLPAGHVEGDDTARRCAAQIRGVGGVASPARARARRQGGGQPGRGSAFSRGGWRPRVGEPEQIGPAVPVIRPAKRRRRGSAPAAAAGRSRRTRRSKGGHGVALLLRAPRRHR